MEERPKAELDLEFGGFEEINPGVFHVGHDESAEFDPVPRRVNRAAHGEGKSERFRSPEAQPLLHGGRLEMEVERQDNG